MTIIAAVARDGHVVMGGDSAVSDDDDLTVVRDPKVSRKGDLLVGVAGEWRLCNLVHHVIEFPARKARTPDMKYLCGPFVDALARAIREKAPHLDAAVETKHGMDFVMLVGYRGGIYTVDANMDVCRSADDFDAIGSGALVARGALFASTKMSPRTSVLTALTAAERYKTSVRRPFKVLTL